MTTQNHRETAKKLREKAAKAKDVTVREQLLLMAADWDKLADDADGRPRSKAR